jgi:hypothetical protein
MVLEKDFSSQKPVRHCCPLPRANLPRPSIRKHPFSCPVPGSSPVGRLRRLRLESRAPLLNLRLPPACLALRRIQHLQHPHFPHSCLTALPRLRRASAKLQLHPSTHFHQNLEIQSPYQPLLQQLPLLAHSPTSNLDNQRPARPPKQAPALLSPSSNQRRHLPLSVSRLRCDNRKGSSNHPILVSSKVLVFSFHSCPHPRVSSVCSVIGRALAFIPHMVMNILVAFPATLEKYEYLLRKRPFI